MRTAKPLVTGSDSSLMNPLASWVILSYAAVLVAGGFMGWRLGGSRLSFTAGLGSAALLSIAYRIGQVYPFPGYFMATAVSLLLGVVFFLRFRKTGKFFPAVPMLVMSGGVVVIMCWVIVVSW